MKVVLLNNNPAVSRLIGLSVNKLGYEFLEVTTKDEILSKPDILVVDSEIDGFDSSLKTLANHTIFLVPKNSQNRPEGGVILEKPFLPTKFIEIMESFSSTSFADFSTKDDENLKFDDFDDVMNDVKFATDMEQTQEDIVKEEDIQEDIKHISDDERLDFDDKINEISDEEDIEESKDEEDFSQDLLNEENLEEKKTVEEFEENLEKEISEIDSKDVDDIDELTSIIDEIDNMGDDNSISNIEDLKQNEDKDLADNLSTNDDFEQKLEEVLGSDDEELNDIQEEEFSTDDGLDFKEDLSIDDESLKEEVVEDIMENDESLNEVLDEVIEQQHDVDCETLDDIHNDDGLDETDMSKDILEEDNEDINNIDEISEKAMKIALNEEVLDKSDDIDINIHDELDIKDNTIKENIAHKISEEINSTLNQSSIREALKNMKININITFEDK